MFMLLGHETSFYALCVKKSHGNWMASFEFLDGLRRVLLLEKNMQS